MTQTVLIISFSDLKRDFERLNAAPLPSSVRAVCLRTPVDTRVVPGHSAWLEGAACHTVRPLRSTIRRMMCGSTLRPPLAKAEGLGVKVMDEAEWLRLLG